MSTTITMPKMPTIVGSYEDGVFTPSMVATAIRNTFNKGAGRPVPAQGIKLNAYNDDGNFINYWSCTYQWTPQDMWDIITSQKWDTNGYSHDELQWKLEVLGKEVANVYMWSHRHLCIDWYDANRKGRTVYWIGADWWVPCSYYYEETRNFVKLKNGWTGSTYDGYFVNEAQAKAWSNEKFHQDEMEQGIEMVPVFINDNGVIDDCSHHYVQSGTAHGGGYEYIKYSKDETAKNFVERILEEDTERLKIPSLGIEFSSRDEIEEFISRD